jgi:Fe-Mn family superoxide dismutase
MFARRDFLRTVAATGAAFALPRMASAQAPAGFALPKLPYDYNALEPSIDAETMTIHHTKHHQAYITNANTLLKDSPDWLKKTPEEIIVSLKDVPEPIRAGVRNNVGGHWNHTFFWNVMAPTGKGGEPKGDLLKALEASFGTVDEFKKVFADAAAKRFGSGWAWLIPGKEKPLAVVSTPNQDSPQMDGGPVPILGLDVWEHAYYLKYRNLRPAYITEWWKVVNWDAVAANFAKKK